MYLIDSNIIIYSYSEQYKHLRVLFLNDLVYISEISRVEILGYYKITTDEELYFNDLFKIVPLLQPTAEIFDKAIEVRKKYNLKLGDSLITATALINNLTIYSRNISDFGKVEELKYINPFANNL